MERIINVGLNSSSASKSQDITSEAAMLLDSLPASVSALGAIVEPRYDEEVLIAPISEKCQWYYLLLKSRDLRLFNDILTGRKTVTAREGDCVSTYRIKFKTFIYTSLEHRRRVEECAYSESEYQSHMQAVTQAADRFDRKSSASAIGTEIDDTVPVGGGYLFIYAPLKMINRALDLIQPHRFLVLDYATRKAARIPDNQMKDFILLYEAMPWNIHVMERSIHEYARNRQRIRITGGSLKGAEGFIVRIHRDRNLVFSFGNMTLAVSGIHAFPFEPVNP